MTIDHDREMRLLLIYPPFSDPTMPPLGVSVLSACVNSSGRHTAHVADLNIAVLDRILSESVLETAFQEAERLGSLPSGRSKLAFELVPQHIEQAKSALKTSA